MKRGRRFKYLKKVHQVKFFYLKKCHTVSILVEECTAAVGLPAREGYVFLLDIE